MEDLDISQWQQILTNIYFDFKIITFIYNMFGHSFAFAARKLKSYDMWTNTATN